MVVSKALLPAFFLPDLTQGFHNKAPPLHLPANQPLHLRNCAGIRIDLTPGSKQKQQIGYSSASTSANGGNTANTVTSSVALLFLDADSTFSKGLYYHWSKFSERYPDINFIAIESFSLGFEPNVCKVVTQPEGSPASFLLDRHDFFGNQYAYEFFNVAPNEILLYNNGARFRYMPKSETDMSRPAGHQWVNTALSEMSRTRELQLQHSPQVKPLFLTSDFDEYHQYQIEDGEVGRIMTAHSKQRCEQHCMEIGCTAMVVYGAHHCTFFAGEPTAITALRTRYSNAVLLVRRPLADVNATQKLLKGFLWSLVILFGSVLLYYAFSRMNSRKNNSFVTNAAEMASMSGMGGIVAAGSIAMAVSSGGNAISSASSTGLNSLIEAAVKEDERYDQEDPAE